MDPDKPIEASRFRRWYIQIASELVESGRKKLSKCPIQTHGKRCEL